MPKIILTDEEKIKLLEAVNAGVEPSPDLLPKLFPGTAEKFDVRALDRAKIPTLEYAGKRSKAAILAEAGAGIGAAPLQIVRSFGEVKEGEWQNLIVQGDNLQFLKTCYRNKDTLIKNVLKGEVKLIYIDPPFATKSDFGGSDGEYSYTDKVDRATFLETLRERLLFLRELLADDGSIYIHLDQKMSHYVKIITDEVFGKDNFQNEIVWCYKSGGVGGSGFAKKHDNIFVYSKTSKRIFNQTNQKSYVLPSGNKNVTYYKDDKGTYTLVKVKDWWDDIGMISTAPGAGRVGYPTQKPEKLLERIILASSNPGDIVLDCFAGSGTTPMVAEKLDRKWIACDFGKHSIYTIQKRMLRVDETEKFGIIEKEDLVKCDDCDSVIEESDSFKKCKKCGSFFEKEIKQIKEKYGKQPTPFSIVSAGAYDFSHVMALGNPEHKDAYIAFVLGLFQLGRDEEKVEKFKLTNIFADKDGSPVEVYPVWDERYLKEVRIDEEYLQEIINQAGGRLSGEYHIITPEHCTNVGDTTLKNSEGKNVTFKFLTFPYKVLEDASRHFELHEQPASQGAVNELITSTAFYFNEDVEIEVVRNDKGLTITKFDTKILNKDGNRFPELEGLAMLLVDVDHEQGKPFDMDKTIFAKDIKEGGVFPVEDISDKTVAVIAIDKHGNESKPFVVK